MMSIIALIVVLIMPLGMILWWIPRCDAIGIQKGERSYGAHEAALMAFADEAASSPSRR